MGRFSSKRSRNNSTRRIASGPCSLARCRCSWAASAMIACAQVRSKRREGAFVIRLDFGEWTVGTNDAILEAAGDVANDAIEEGAKAGHSTGCRGLQHAAVAEAF